MEVFDDFNFFLNLIDGIIVFLMVPHNKNKIVLYKG